MNIVLPQLNSAFNDHLHLYTFVKYNTSRTSIKINIKDRFFHCTAVSEKVIYK